MKKHLKNYSDSYNYKVSLSPLESESHYLNSFILKRMDEVLQGHTSSDIAIHISKLKNPSIWQEYDFNWDENTELCMIVAKSYNLCLIGYDSSELKETFKEKGGDTCDYALV